MGMDPETRVSIENGKYEYIIRANGRIDILRFGEPWIDDFRGHGTKALMGLIHEAHALQQLRKPDAPCKLPDDIVQMLQPEKEDTRFSILQKMVNAQIAHLVDDDAPLPEHIIANIPKRQKRALSRVLHGFAKDIEANIDCSHLSVIQENSEVRECADCGAVMFREGVWGDWK